MYPITILWGENPEPDAVPEKYSFNTLAERDAFILGIEQCDGWQGYEVINQEDYS